jgi:hypothetical protein
MDLLNNDKEKNERSDEDLLAHADRIMDENDSLFKRLAQPSTPQNEEETQLSEDTEKAVLIENQEAIPNDRNALINSIITKHFKKYDAVFRALAKL